MTKRLRVHFDGKVLVPEEPVDLPLGESIQVIIDEPAETGKTEAPVSPEKLKALVEWIESLPPLPPGSLPKDLAAQHDHYLYGTPKKP